jgi:AcrR family transcriptional regulator
MTVRRRLTTGERRDVLLDSGERLFAARPFDEVLMEEVADDAGVSRALLYRHFASKRDLFAAIYQRAADRLVVASDPQPGNTLVEQVAIGLDAHIDYFVAHRHTVLAANRALAGDPVIQAIISEELAVLRSRLLDASGFDARRRELVASVVMSWLLFVRALCVDWLEDQKFGRVELRDICMGALFGALGPLAESNASGLTAP